MRLDLLELFGREYVLDHILRQYRKAQEENAFRVYITDALKAAVENTTHFIVPGHGAVDYGASMRSRWADIIKPPEPERPEDPRSCEEIAADIFKRAKIGGKAVKS